MFTYSRRGAILAPLCVVAALIGRPGAAFAQSVRFLPPIGRKLYVAMVLVAVLAILVCSPSLARDRPGAPETRTAPQGDTYKCIA